MIRPGRREWVAYAFPLPAALGLARWGRNASGPYPVGWTPAQLQSKLQKPPTRSSQGAAAQITILQFAPAQVAGVSATLKIEWSQFLPLKAADLCSRCSAGSEDR